MVRRILVLLGLVLMLLPAFGGCGITEEGGLAPDSGVGGSGADGGGGIGGGQCFPGDKLCPDPKDPLETTCVKAELPANGCSKSTACAPCVVPHASAKCDAGACAVDQCDAGWADCNNNPVDGCEVDLTGDKNHCGDCATDCVGLKGEGWICENKVCIVNECCPPPGGPQCATKRDCDGDKSNGCEVDIAIDPANCKTCGNACALSHASAGCSQEVCVVTSCNGGWANCDTNDVNGCEININQGDKANCGPCGKACNETNASATCIGGTCVLACAGGWGNCNGNPDDGCETNLNNNPLHCSGCNKPCNPANVNAPLCTNGACDYTTCKNGYADCDNNRANGCEINILQNVNHCGTCGNKCTPPSGGTVVCNNGACAQGCGAPLTNCSGVCVNLGNDTNNCGSCGSKCTPPANSNATCSGGGCGFVCNNGWASCGTTQCYQNGSDPTHCCSGSGCNSACTNCPGPTTGSGNATCSTGSCGVTCTAPTSGKCGNGCYNFTNDKGRCGGCGTSCTDPANGVNNCVSSVCTITCNTGFHKCGNLCKADNDATACGATCQNCSPPTSGTGTPTCSGGTCGINCGGTTPNLCGSDCVDFQTDDNHCGDCPTKCGASQNCNAGKCTGGSGGTGGTGGSGGTGGTGGSGGSTGGSGGT